MTSKTSLADIEQKHPGFRYHYNNKWQIIVKSALHRQAQRNSESEYLRGIKSIIESEWPYLNDIELNSVTDRISGRFNNNMDRPEWNEYRKLLPNLFKKHDKKRNKSHETISNCLNISTIFQEPKVENFEIKEKKYTVTKVTSSGESISVQDVYKDDLSTIIEMLK
jgi:hypothetical protein